MSMRKDFRSKKCAAKRDVVDILRVRYWFEGIRGRLGAKSSYALEKRLEPEAFRRRFKNGKPSYPGKWIGYEVGARTPQTKLVNRVNDELPGSRRELCHPLWDLLRSNPARRHLKEDYLRLLTPDVQALLYSNSQTVWARVPVTRGLVMKLERNASLDALAALVWLLHEDLSQEKPMHAEQLKRTIYNVLLMRGVWWQERQLAGLFLEIFSVRVLSLDSPLHQCFRMSTSELFEASTVLNLMVHHTPECGRHPLNWPRRVRIMRELLGGKKGYGVTCALAPVYVPSGAGVPAITSDDLQEQERLREEVLAQLRAALVAHWIPEKLVCAGA